MGMPVSPNYGTWRARFRADDGNETSATWTSGVLIPSSPVPDPHEQQADTVFRLRLQLVQTVTGATENLSRNYKVRYSLNAGSYTDVAAINATNAPIRYAASAHVSDGNSTTQQFTWSSGTYVSGRIDNNNNTGTITFSGSGEGHSEFEFILELYSPQLDEGDILSFRIYTTDNVALDTYEVTPRVTPLLTPPDIDGSMAVVERNRSDIFAGIETSPEVFNQRADDVGEGMVELKWDTVGVPDHVGTQS